MPGTPATLSDLTEADAGHVVTVSGTLSDILERPVYHDGQPTGRTWASAKITDSTRTVELLFFPNAYAQHRNVIAEDATLTLEATFDTGRLVDGWKGERVPLPTCLIAKPTTADAQ